VEVEVGEEIGAVVEGAKVVVAVVEDTEGVAKES